MAVVILVTLASMIFSYPTARYFLALNSGNAPEEQLESFKARSIPLGLDLQGGVDVLLAVDVDKTAVARVSYLFSDIRRRFQAEKINAQMEITPAGNGIRLTIPNERDLREAQNILGDFETVFEPWNPDDLRQGAVVLKLTREEAQRRAQDAVESTLKVIRERVDTLGVTQPSVALQGKNRIRVQVPGYKDPEKLIKTVIRPATLEFRLVHDDNANLTQTLFEATETTKVKEGQTLPAGYVARMGKITDVDQNGVPTVVKRVHLVRDKVELTGESLRDAWVVYNPASLDNQITVSLEFDRKGGQIFKQVTTENTGKNLAIILEGTVYSAPVIREVIPDGRAEISGNFTQEDARDLSLVLKAGALPAELKVEQKRTVGATLGVDSIKDSIRALLIGSIAVSVFMVVYYGTAGLIADIALVLNTLIIMAVLALSKATLTLSGIGGILLTVGMAVDANVLIYERIREEIEKGRPLKIAINNGFARAFSVIFDSNLTTLISALVLLQFGEGSVKGFALTMCFGLLANLYTGLTVTLALTTFWFQKRGSLNVGKLHMFKKTTIPFIGLRKFSYVISLLMVCGSIGLLTYRGGPTYAVDFSGGILVDVEFGKTVGTAEVRQSLIDAGLTRERVQKVEGSNEFLLRHTLIDDDVDKTQGAIEQALAARFGNGNFTVLGTQSVGREVGQEFVKIAIWAVIYASLGILIYLWFRFEASFGAGTVIALIHDLIITTGFLTLMGVDVSLDVVAALLVVLGFSVNDTIVIFDRIRENRVAVAGRHFGEICDLSMNQSLSRTIITSGTVFLAMLVMYFLGGKGLEPFAVTLLAGVTVGTYSTDFVAVPLVHDWYEHRRRKQSKATSGTVGDRGRTRTA